MPMKARSVPRWQSLSPFPRVRSSAETPPAGLLVGRRQTSRNGCRFERHCSSRPATNPAAWPWQESGRPGDAGGRPRRARITGHPCPATYHYREDALPRPAHRAPGTVWRTTGVIECGCVLRPGENAAWPTAPWIMVARQRVSTEDVARAGAGWGPLALAPDATAGALRRSMRTNL